MSANAADIYGRQYADTLMLLLQQEGGMLRGKVTERTDYKGEQVSPVDQEGSVEMQEVTTRDEDIEVTDSSFDRRWLFPTAFDLAQRVDTFDKLQTLSDPSSTKVQNSLKAAGRRIDRTLISGMLGTNYTGKNGSTQTAFDSNNVVDVAYGASVNTSMTVKKIVHAKKIMRANYVNLEEEELYLGITSDEEEKLLQETQVISLEYQNRPVVEDGRLTRIMGLNVVISELFGENLSSGDHQCLMWCKSGVHLGLWSDVRTDVSQIKTKKGLPWQVYVWLMLDACRLEEGKLVNIKCDF